MWSTEYLKSQGLCKSHEDHQDALATPLDDARGALSDSRRAKDTKITKALHVRSLFVIVVLFVANVLVALRSLTPFVTSVTL